MRLARLNGDALLRSGTMVVGEGTEMHEDSERVGEIHDGVGGLIGEREGKAGQEAREV